MSTYLQPGEQIRPILCLEEAQRLAERVYGLKVASIKELESYDDKNYHIQVTQPLFNSDMIPVWEHGYVLKIMNSMDSKKEVLLDGQNSIMLFLATANIRCTVPVKNLSGNYFSLEELESSKGGSRYAVRLLRFQPGEILFSVPATPALCLDTGHFLARMNTALATFSHRAFENHQSIWRLDMAPKVIEFLYAVKEEDKVTLVKDVLSHFEKRVTPAIPQLPQGMLHGDFNEHNILVQQQGGVWRVDGVLDFGDSHYSCYVFEVALATCYLMLQAKPPALQPLRAGALVVAGYHQLRPLSDRELELLQVCVCARLCQSLVLGVYSHAQDPTNTYVLQTAKAGDGWKVLADTWVISGTDFLAAIKQEIEALK